MIQLALGSVYAFSIFTSSLSQTLDHDSKSFAILGIFAVAIAVFAVTMIFAGRFQDKRGPRVVASVSGVVYALGYILASFVNDNLLLMYLSYGVIGGIGLGLGYVCPLAAGVKWFPDKKGLVSGIVVAGFGAGAFIFAQIGDWMIKNPDIGLDGAFLYLGMIFLVTIVAGAQLLRNPPAGWRPRGYIPQSKENGKVIALRDYEWSKMVHTRTYFLLWAMFALSATAGLMMIGNVKNLALYLDPSENLMVVAQFSLIAGILALFNGAGRIGWGAVSDRLGRTNTLKLMFIVQSAVLFGAAGFLLVKPEGEMLQFFGLTSLASLVGFTFGGNFALFPSMTADYFGTKNLGINYGLVFTGYGAAGILGALIPGLLAGTEGGFVFVFVAIGFASLVAAGLAFLTRRPTESKSIAASPTEG
ncbi:MAG TPA: MFS transporter [Euryarchaeota archaeon]|nr:MFS transporter [Euryarchaeota archaeon]